MMELQQDYLNDHVEYMELRSKLEKAEELYRKSLANYKEAEQLMNEAESTFTYEEANLRNVSQKLDYIKKRLQQIEVQEHFKNITMTGDKFKDSFIIASWFCSHDQHDYRGSFLNVSIRDNEIIGCDGFQAISIACDCIPEEYKNALIHWKCRDVLEINKTEYQSEYPSLESVFSEKEYSYSIIREVSKLKEQWTADKNQESPLIFSIGSVKFGFKPEMLQNALNAIGDESKVELRYTASNAPVMLITGNKKIVILPTRLKKGE